MGVLGQPGDFIALGFDIVQQQESGALWPLSHVPPGSQDRARMRVVWVGTPPLQAGELDSAPFPAAAIETTVSAQGWTARIPGSPLVGAGATEYIAVRELLISLGRP